SLRSRRRARRRRRRRARSVILAAGRHAGLDVLGRLRLDHALRLFVARGLAALRDAHAKLGLHARIHLVDLLLAERVALIGRRLLDLAIGFVPVVEREVIAARIVAIVAAGAARAGERDRRGEEDHSHLGGAYHINAAHPRRFRRRRAGGGTRTNPTRTRWPSRPSAPRPTRRP